MQEFGIKIVDSTGQALSVYFMPLSYIDWVKYSDMGVASINDPSVSRYILKTYVTRALSIGTSDTSEIPIETLCEMPPSIQHKILEAIVNKSGFDMEDSQYSEVITKLERKSRTLMGCYDYFIFLHGGLDFYLRCLELDSKTRAQIIMLMEKTTGISVYKRFNDSIKMETPLDLVSENSKYEGKVRSDMRSGRIQPQKRASSLPEGTHQVRDNVPPDLGQMIAHSRSTLENDLRAGQRKKKQSFNWQEDEAAISGFDISQDRQMYNTERKSPDNIPGREG